MATISREALKEEVSAILRGADLETLSAKKVRLQLEAKLGVDLSDRKQEIDSIIMADVEDQVNSHSEEESEEEEEAEEAPKAKKAPKANLKKKADSDSEADADDKEGDGDDDYEPSANKKARGKPKQKKRKGASDDESDEDWGKRKKQAKKAGGGGRGGKSAFTKSFKLSAELADVVGSDVMPRHEVVKKLWAVIKERDLQDPKNKQFAICDEQLLKVIGVKRFRTFGMMKHLKDHFLEAA